MKMKIQKENVEKARADCRESEDLPALRMNSAAATDDDSSNKKMQNVGRISIIFK